MKKSGIVFGIIAGIIVLFILSTYLFLSNKSSRSRNNEEIHYHAGFIVYEDDLVIDFSDMKYMHIEPCGIAEHENEDEQNEKAHLHNNIGDIVHIHRPDAVWNDLFINVHYQLKDPVIGYINGKLIENILDQPILPYESVVILSGSNTDSESKKMHIVPKEYIEETENSTESC